MKFLVHNSKPLYFDTLPAIETISILNIAIYQLQAALPLYIPTPENISIFIENIRKYKYYK